MLWHTLKRPWSVVKMQNGRAEGTAFRRDETTFSRADIELHNNLAGSRIAEQLVNWLVALMQENSLQIGF